jgi:hypothetical protein
MSDTRRFYATLDHSVMPTALAGRIDAIVLENDRASDVLDWKSDIAPTEQDSPTPQASCIILSDSSPCACAFPYGSRTSEQVCLVRRRFRGRGWRLCARLAESEKSVSPFRRAG